MAKIIDIDKLYKEVKQLKEANDAQKDADVALENAKADYDATVKQTTETVKASNDKLTQATINSKVADELVNNQINYIVGILKEDPNNIPDPTPDIVPPVPDPLPPTTPTN